MPKRWMITQANPQKWLRDSEDESLYKPEEFNILLEKANASFDNLIRYCKFSHETGEGGLRHLQIFLYLNRDSRKSAIIKIFPKGDISICRSSSPIAMSYIGNIDFIHSKGDKKGGSVEWLSDWGIPPDENTITQANGDSSTESRLLSIKEAIDTGESYFSLWNSDFYIMCRYNSPLLHYYKVKRGVSDELGNLINKNEGIVSLKELDDLREKNLQLNIDNKAVRDFLADHIEALENERN